MVNIKIKDDGVIKVQLDEKAAPITVKNFTELVNKGFYDGLIFHRVIQEAQLKLTGEIGNDTNILEDLSQACIQKPLIRVLLDSQHVRHFQDLLVLCVALTHGLAKQLVLDHFH